MRAILRTMTRWMGGGLVAAAPVLAHAAPGDHIQAGNAEITPEVAVGVEGMTNAFRVTAGNQQGAFAFTFVPRLAVKVEGPKVRWTFDGQYQLRKYFEQAIAQRLDQFSNFRINTKLDALPEGVFGFQIRERIGLLGRNPEQGFASGVPLSQLRNDLGTTLIFRVGPEFSIRPGVDWAWHQYRIPNVASGSNLSVRNAIIPKLGIEWLFFPRTAFVVEGWAELNRWGNNVVPLQATPGSAAANAGSELGLPDSDFVKAVTGVRGRFSRIFNLTVLVGYGYGNYLQGTVLDDGATETDAAGQGFDKNVSATDAILVTVRPSVDWGYSDEKTFGQQFALTYRKDFEDSFFSNYMHVHDARISLDSRFTRFVTTHVAGVFRVEDYHGEVERQDFVPRVQGSVDINPTRYLSLILGVDWTRRISNDPTIEYDNVTGSFVTRFRY